MYRRIDGSVTAVNPYAFSGAGGFRSGPLPYIKITGTAKSQQDAIDITNHDRARVQEVVRGAAGHEQVPRSTNRVLVEQVNSAEHGDRARAARSRSSASAPRCSCCSAPPASRSHSSA